MLARAESSGAARTTLVEFKKPREKRQRRAHTVAADLDQNSARTALQQYKKILAKLATWISTRKASPPCEEDWDALTTFAVTTWP